MSERWRERDTIRGCFSLSVFWFALNTVQVLIASYLHLIKCQSCRLVAANTIYTPQSKGISDSVRWSPELHIPLFLPSNNSNKAKYPKIFKKEKINLSQLSFSTLGKNKHTHKKSNHIVDGLQGDTEKLSGMGRSSIQIW